MTVLNVKAWKEANINNKTFLKKVLRRLKVLTYFTKEKMGGNALKNVVTVRKNRVEYAILKKEILNRIDIFNESTSEKVEYGLIEEAPGKEDFGDLDVLVSGNVASLICSFHPDEIHINDGVYSFNYGDFQVDFITVNSIPMAQFCYGYGDSGSILGRLFKSYGFFFSRAGLTMQLKNLDSSSLLLSHDPALICSYFGYDYARWCRGFETVEDCFLWLTQSRYFDPQVFLGEKTSKRSVTRGFYISFVEYLVQQNLKKEEVKELSEPLEFFSCQKVYQERKEALEVRRRVHLKFNGNLFLDLAGSRLQSHIKDWMRDFKECFLGEEEFQNWVLKSSEEEIKKEVKDFVTSRLV